jgi:hypothetical protein
MSVNRTLDIRILLYREAGVHPIAAYSIPEFAAPKSAKNLFGSSRI